MNVGATVRVNLPKNPEWHDAEGIVVALHPPVGVPNAAVVRAYGRERIIAITSLERLDNGAAGAGGSSLSPLPERHARGKDSGSVDSGRRSRKAAM